MVSGTIDDLRKVVVLRDIPEEHLQWIFERSKYKEYEDSEIMLKSGEPTLFLGLIFEGRGNFYMNINGKLIYYFTFENNEETGGATGLIPYSRMTHAPGETIAEGKVKVFQLDKKYFAELELLNPLLIQRLIGYMTERAKSFATRKSHLEKVNALGQLAAGIAHELNNPAASISRNSDELKKIIKDTYELTENMLVNQISPALIQNIRGRVEYRKKLPQKKLTALQQIECEDDIMDWLVDNGLSEYGHLAETYADSGFKKEDLEYILKNTPEKSMIYVLFWIENYLNSQRLIKDLENASFQITSLVGAIKSHVHMDRSNAKQPCSIQKDIENTLRLLGYKIRDKNITVNKNFCEDFPEVQAFAGELNQVWTNLIDNAVYAVDKNGIITIDTSCDINYITVRIIDNGPGIPSEIISRIFDPFFTTKKVGEGTGIGLDLVTRIIKQHNGEVKVNSVPGKTEFIVRIPIR